MSKLTVRELAIAGLVAALYTTISYFMAPISFGVYQVRVAEALTLLPFLTRSAIPGLFVGCLLANIFGGNGWMDIIFGSLLTLAAAFLTRAIYHFTKRTSGFVPALLALLLMWVGAVYLLSEFQLSRLFFSGLLLSLVGIIISSFGIWLITRKSSSVIKANFLIFAGLVILVIAGLMLNLTDSNYSTLIGFLLLSGTGVAALYLASFRAAGKNTGILIAPLPPVLLNAFGVAAYLAPIIGTGYWFTVQMIGVGQLIACYLIGVPLLLLLQKRNLMS